MDDGSKWFLIFCMVIFFLLMLGFNVNEYIKTYGEIEIAKIQQAEK